MRAEGRNLRPGEEGARQAAEHFAQVQQPPPLQQPPVEESEDVVVTGENPVDLSKSTAADVLTKVGCRKSRGDGFCCDYSMLASLSLIKDPFNPTQEEKQLVSGLRDHVAESTGEERYRTPDGYLTGSPPLNLDWYGDVDSLAASAKALGCDIVSIDTTQPQKQNLAFFECEHTAKSGVTTEGSQRLISAEAVLARLKTPTETPLVILRWNGTMGPSGHYDATEVGSMQWEAPGWVKDILSSQQPPSQQQPSSSSQQQPPSAQQPPEAATETAQPPPVNEKAINPNQEVERLPIDDDRCDPLSPMDVDEVYPPVVVAACPTVTQPPPASTTTELKKTEVEQELRAQNFLRTFAGNENGSAIVRCLLSAAGKVTPQQLSEPSEVDLEVERAARESIVGDSLEEWKEVGYFNADTVHSFLQAAAEYFQKPIIELKLRSEVYTLRRFGTGGDVTLGDASKSLLLERAIVSSGSRKGEHFSPFLHIERPATYERLIELCSDGYGVTYDRSSYTAPALTALTGKKPPQSSLLPVDHTHVVVSANGLGLEDDARKYFSLLELTFREECERRELLGEIPQGSCVPFTTRTGVSATFLRKDLLEKRKEWASLVTKEELDVRSEIRNLEKNPLLRKCDLHRMKQLWSAGIQRCPSSGVLTFDPNIPDPEYQEKLKNWNELTEWLHVQSNKKRKRE